MVSTCSDATALEHILGVVLEKPPIFSTGTYIPAFRASFTEADVICTSDFISIDTSAYGAIPFSAIKNGMDKDTTLNVIQVKKLSSLISWFGQTTSCPAGHWFDLTKDTYRTWPTESIIPSVTSVAATAVTVPPTPISAISNFRKGVKQSISDDKPFKEDCYFNSWQCHLQTRTAHSRNVDNVINLAYVPSSPEEKYLLDEQKKFIYSGIVEQTVLTPDGIIIIRVHSDTGDTSAGYSDQYGRKWHWDSFGVIFQERKCHWNWGEYHSKFTPCICHRSCCYPSWTRHCHSQPICQLWQGTYHSLFIPTTCLRHSCSRSPLLQTSHRNGQGRSSHLCPLCRKSCPPRYPRMEITQVHCIMRSQVYSNGQASQTPTGTSRTHTQIWYPCSQKPEGYPGY